MLAKSDKTPVWEALPETYEWEEEDLQESSLLQEALEPRDPEFDKLAMQIVWNIDPEGWEIARARVMHEIMQKAGQSKS